MFKANWAGENSSLTGSNLGRYSELAGIRGPDFASMAAPLPVSCQLQGISMLNRVRPRRSISCAGSLRLCCLALVCLTLSLAASAEVFTARVTSVVDGDTLWVQPVDGSAPRKLRLAGIDAPEICQSGGAASRAALRALVTTASVQVALKYYDDYGRGLARIRVGQQDVAAVMVRSGQAWSYRWRHSPGPYAAEEAAARQARAGLFSEAAPELPRDFRLRHGSCYPGAAQLRHMKATKPRLKRCCRKPDRPHREAPPVR